MVVLTPIEREKLSKFVVVGFFSFFFFSFFFFFSSQMLNVSTFGNTADIYAIVHLVPHASAYHGLPEPQQR